MASVLRTLVTECPIAVAMFDRELRYLAYSRRWLRDYRLADENLLGRSHYEVLPEIPDRWRAIHRRCLEGAAERADEDAFVRADGRTEWLRWDVRPWRHDDGAIGGLIMYTESITARKEAEQELVRQRRVFETLVSNLPGMVYRCLNDSQWTMEFVSSGCRALTGYAPVDLLRNTTISYADLIHPEDRDTVWRDVQTAVAARQPFQLRYRITTATGQQKWVFEQGSGVMTDGHLDALEGFITDVTALEEAQRSLEELARFPQENPDPVLRIRRDGQILFANPAATRLASRLGIIGRQTPEYLADLLTRALNDGTPVEHVVTRSDGVFAFFLAPISARDYVNVYVQDRTAAVAAETGHRESEQRYHALYSGMREGLALHELVYGERGDGIDYRILDVNPAYEALLGIPRDAVVGRLATEVYGTAEAPYLDRFSAVAVSGEPTRFETTFAPIGKMLDISVFSPTLGQFATVFQDITEQRRLEDQFRQAQKLEAIGRLAGGVAHDFNNRLTAILGFAALVMEGVDPESQAWRDLQQVKTAAERSAVLTRQLLAFSRRQVLKVQPLDLNGVVRETDSLLARLLGADIQRELDLGADVPTVMADAGQLEQVITNLAVNARDAMPDGGRLTISTRAATFSEGEARQRPGMQPGPHAAISVTDTGHGMDPATQAQIFEPFFTTKAPGQGTGLGLSTVYGIVKQMGGFVWVYSEVGRGTRFRLYFPATAEAARRVEAMVPEVPPSGHETILLVEDEASVRALATRVLQRSGYTVIDADTAETALDAADRHGKAIDLLVTDVVLPGISGLALANRPASRHPVRVLYMSGYAAPIAEGHGTGAGDAVLDKPFTAPSLLEAVRAVLDQRAENPDRQEGHHAAHADDSPRGG